MTWTPHATVAAIVERDGKFLFVEETTFGKKVINQPAGHVEPGETLLEAVKRETLEETGWQVSPKALVGFYTYTAPANGITYYRFCFYCHPIQRDPNATLDPDIDQVHWFSPEELSDQSLALRSPLVRKCLEDHLQGKAYPLNLIYEHGADLT